MTDKQPELNDDYYEQPPYRPPTEGHSLLLRVTRNCSWNKCEFCTMYPGTKLEIRSVEEVKGDIRAMKKHADEIKAYALQKGHGGNVAMVARANGVYWLTNDGVKNVFIADSNSVIIKTEDLVEILRYLYETFPTIERVTSYARGKTLAKKSLDELKMLRQAGLTRLHVGLETGDGELLKIIQKGATPEEMISGGKKAIEAGFELSMYVMPGLGGREMWEQHVRGSAHVLNAVNPHFIRLRTLFVPEGTPLHARYQSGQFTRQTTEALLREVRLLIELLNVDAEFIASDHIANRYMWGIDGVPNKEKERMLKQIDELIAQAKRTPDEYPVYLGL
jgi:histone acetyltransferase (RNA polymerase elongator complex component)